MPSDSETSKKPKQSDPKEFGRGPGDDGPSDDQAARGGEIAALFERHYSALIGFLVNRLHDETEAGEVAQEAYLRILEQSPHNQVSFLRAYLYRTALNIASERGRRRRQSQRLDGVDREEDLIDTRDPGRVLRGEEDLNVVRQALMELPAAYRRAFLRRRIDDATTEELGNELGLKSSQVRLYLRRAVAYCRFRVMGLSPDRAREHAFK